MIGLRPMYVPVKAVKSFKNRQMQNGLPNLPAIWLPCDCRHTRPC
jgi:hypothetical protein